MPGKVKKYGLGATSNRHGYDVKLPSGHTAKVRRPGTQGLIAIGVLDNLDTLVGLAQNTGTEGGKMPTKEDLETALAVVDKVVEYCVIEPATVRPVRRDANGKPALDAEGAETPLTDDERAEDVVYTDEIPLDNRMFILNFCIGGSADLEAFREESAKALGDMEAVSGVPVQAKRVTGD